MAACTRCGVAAAPGDRFCGGCGAALSGAPAAAVAPTPPPAGAASPNARSLKALSNDQQGYVVRNVMAGAPRELIVAQLVCEGVGPADARSAVLEAEAGLRRVAPVMQTAARVGQYAGEARSLYTQVVLGLFAAAVVLMVVSVVPFLGVGWGFAFGFLTAVVWEAVVAVRLVLRHVPLGPPAWEVGRGALGDRAAHPGGAGAPAGRALPCSRTIAREAPPTPILYV